MDIRLGEVVFDEAARDAFVALSGDANPVHVDALAARRTAAGAPIVHGVHQVLAALEAHFAEGGRAAPTRLRVAFEKMLPVGATAEVIRSRDDARGFVLEVRFGGKTTAKVVASLDGAPAAGAAMPTLPRFAPGEPLAQSEAALPTLAGSVPLPCDAVAATAAFPATAAAIGAERVAGLLAATFLVGMVAPGLHSLFRGLSLTSTTAAAPWADGLSFRTALYDPRFRLSRLAVGGAGWEGTIDAHLRPEPVAQPAARAVAEAVAPGEFAGLRSLVVGGSRGLGEVIAKILAAGGAEVVITYAHGAADAERVAAEIAAAGGACAVARLDVGEGADGLAGAAGGSFDQLYYMATPAIRAGGAGSDPATRERYLAAYVDAFAGLAEASAARAERRLDVFYPSTVYVTAPPEGFVDYAMAKAAGEVLCAALRRDPRFGTVVAERLPRLASDQTVGLAAETFPEPVPLLAAVVRAVSAGRRAG